MKNCIPGELWNQIGVPLNDTTDTNVSTYISEMAYKIPYVSDLLLTKELWHSVCDFSFRFGALRERISGNVSSESLSVAISPAHGKFLRAIGADVGGTKVGVGSVSIESTASGMVATFSASSVASSAEAHVDVSVVPDMSAMPTNQKVPLWFLRTYDKPLMACTLMRIYSMNGEKWSDAQLAKMNATAYLGECNRLSHGLITSGMRRTAMTDAESILVRGAIQQPPVQQTAQQAQAS